MKRRVVYPKTPSSLQRPNGLDSKTWKSIEPVFKASQQAQRETGRFRFYPYLVEVHRTYREWKRLGIAKKNGAARRIVFRDRLQEGHQPSQNVD